MSQQSLEQLEAELGERKRDFVAMAAVFDIEDCSPMAPVSQYREVIGDVTNPEAIQKLAPILSDVEAIQQEYYERLVD